MSFQITGRKPLDTMIQLSPLLVLPLISFFFNPSSTLKVDDEYNRPQFHLTPEKGWMNDPNGLWYDRKEKLWHAYYQHNADVTYWANPVAWGHSTSKDLISWEYHGDALTSDAEDEGIFSGSVVVDRNNTSGFFNDSQDPEQRVVAIYTLDTSESETQEIAYSLDAGYSFIKYDNNPVIDVDTKQQRDPKVHWNEETEEWIMVVAKTQEYKVQIYGSPDLKEWELKSNFSLHGVLGFQYECPGLFKLPIENPIDESVTEKWVMILAINPGSPLGGSINQYFIGDFDGTEFVADDPAARFMDLGKDYYAFQAFDNTEPEDGAIGFAWASNWQYSTMVPTKAWRSSMSLPRKHTLRYVDVNTEARQLSLVQKPVFDTKETRANKTLRSWDVVNEYEVSDVELDSESLVATDFNSGRNSSGVFDFNLTFTLTDLKLNWVNGSQVFTININSQSVEGTTETIQIAFDAISTTWFLDRTTQNPFQRNTPHFTERVSLYQQSISTGDEGNVYHIYGIVDRNILELYFNYGEIVSTNTFFFSQNKIPSGIEVTTDTEISVFTINSLNVRELEIE